MAGRRQAGGVKTGLVFLLLLAFAPAVRAQPAPSPAGPVPAEPPPEQPGIVLPADQQAPAGYPPPSQPPPAYPGPGYAPPPSSPQAPYAQARASGAERHDGFYLRMQLGVGYTSMSSTMNGTDRTLAGGGRGFEIALGAALNPHLIIYGTLISAEARDPESKFGGQPPDTSTAKGFIAGTVDIGGFGAAGVVGVGGGMAYYLDSNLFFAGSLLGSRLFRDDLYGNLAGRSDLGFTFEGLLGKEWWVSANWGLGVCGQLLLGAMKDRPYTNETVGTWRLAVFSALLSASYN